LRFRRSVRDLQSPIPSSGDDVRLEVGTWRHDHVGSEIVNDFTKLPSQFRLRLVIPKHDHTMFEGVYRKIKW